MSDSAFNDELLERELFGGDSDELDGAGIGAGGMMDMDDDDGDMAGLDGADSGTTPASAAASAAPPAGPAAVAAAAADPDAKPAGARAPALDIELDDPPGETTVLGHPPRAPPTVPSAAATCQTYSILPTMALINQYQIHAVAAVADMRWVFTGGEDGYIKRWDFYATASGRQLLTQGQRHPYVDSVTKAGVMASYWDHSDTSETGIDVLSPVYSLAVHSQAEWLVSGMKSGRIGLWTVRHDEGRRITLLAKHRGPVSVLRISPDEFGLVSGSWDRAVLYWDLNTGKLARMFAGHTSQISSIAFRPTWGGEQYEEYRQQAADAGGDDGGDGASFGSRQPSPVIMTTSIDGQCLLWDVRAPRALPHSFAMPAKTPPWAAAACWSCDGRRVYVGRRNNTVDEYELGMGPQPVRTLRLPTNSGPVTALAAMSNGRSLICASTDNVRMWDLDQSADRRSPVPFQIIPGHHGGTVSSVLVSNSSRYMLTTSGNRGWDGTSNNVFLGYEIKPVA
ncbi:Transcription factor spt8 [Coemansia javaensis]|uniref:Transcription factor spt8 n=1 Tax=Coemansia javaensis TaxID=2761396 RepID=A0A9W8HKQ7_9FUNG|nr:Transcription factor spt8 [Coemansia javaensis]